MAEVYESASEGDVEYMGKGEPLAKLRSLVPQKLHLTPNSLKPLKMHRAGIETAIG